MERHGKRQKLAPVDEHNDAGPSPGHPNDSFTSVDGANWTWAGGTTWINVEDAAEACGCSVADYCWVSVAMKAPQSDPRRYMRFCPCATEHGDHTSDIHRRSIAARRDSEIQVAVRSLIMTERGALFPEAADNVLTATGGACNCTPQCEPAYCDTPHGSHGFNCKLLYEQNRFTGDGRDRYGPNSAVVLP